jgi:hypothetical protein
MRTIPSPALGPKTMNKATGSLCALANLAERRERTGDEHPSSIGERAAAWARSFFDEVERPPVAWLAEMEERDLSSVPAAWP